LRNVKQQDAIKALERAGGILRRRTKRGHAVIKMPNGVVVSLPTGVVKVGLLISEIKKAGLTEEAFIELL
jgi:hypothetical protein